MDLGITSESWGVDDTSWLASRKGLDTCRSVTLDVSTFTQATHYPDGFLPSGLPLAHDTAKGMYVPYDSAGVGDTGILAGFLRGVVHIGDPAPARAGAALQWEGVVDSRFLPLPVDAAGRTDVAAHFRFENVGA